jgi:hypothetical protein
MDNGVQNLFWMDNGVQNLFWMDNGVQNLFWKHTLIIRDLFAPTGIAYLKTQENFLASNTFNDLQK